MISESRMSQIFRQGVREAGSKRGLTILILALTSGLALASSVTNLRILGGVLLLVTVAIALTVSGELRAIRRQQKERAASRPLRREPSADPMSHHERSAQRDRLLAVAEALGLESPSQPSQPEKNSALQPMVSVILPVFNDARYIAETIESVKQQTYTRWECIVVDDASTDTSWDVIGESTAGDERFVLIQNAENRGPGGSRNQALSVARGEYTAFIDGDDLLLRESLADRIETLAAASENPYVVGSFCGVRFSPEDVTLDQLSDRYRSTQPSFVDLVIADGEAPFTMIAPLVLTERIRSIGGLDESMRRGAVDWDLWYRILRNGHVFVGSPFQGAVYRQRPGGITRGNPASHTAAAAKLIEAAHRSEHPDVLIDPTPYPMLEPVGAYRARLKVAERATRFAAMALVDGDHGGMQATLEVLEPGSWPLLQRHLDLPSLVGRGAARALGVRPTEMEGLEDALAPFVAEVKSAIKKSTK